MSSPTRQAISAGLMLALFAATPGSAAETAQSHFEHAEGSDREGRSDREGQVANFSPAEENRRASNPVSTKTGAR